MTTDIEQCCQFIVYLILIENVGMADGMLLVTASFRHSVLFQASAAILAVILESGSVT
jgi:hypothetical protein